MQTIVVLDLVPLKLVSACLPLRYQDSHRVIAGGRDDPAILDINVSWDTVLKAAVKSMATHTLYGVVVSAGCSLSRCLL